MQSHKKIRLGALAVCAVLIFSSRVSAMEPLRHSARNPRYFADGSGNVVYLTGSHTWSNFLDIGTADSVWKFDYAAYLEFLKKHHHNFFRLWNWEQVMWAPWTKDALWFSPSPFMRTGPGMALDGKPKFDLTKFNENYFQRMRNRVMQARAHGIYVSVMLFNGFSIECKEPEETTLIGRLKDAVRTWRNKGCRCRKNGNPWLGHPFNRDNNINGIDGDPDGDGEGREVHTLRIPEVTRIQERYVRKVIDTLNDLPNVLFEIANESHDESTEWQYHIIRFIKQVESMKPYQHPVGMTLQWPGGDNRALFESPADWISPGEQDNQDYKFDPPAADGKKVILIDTDHLWGVGGSRKWVWKSFLRGLNCLFMDPYQVEEFQHHPTKPEWEPIRQAMGYARLFADKINLVGMAPMPDLTSTGYCLAAVGDEYLIYQPERGRFSVRLPAGEYAVEWFDPDDGSDSMGEVRVKSGNEDFLPPSHIANDSVLHLKRLGAWSSGKDS
jgi:hypothetical protein